MVCEGVKTCSKCGEEKPLALFHADSTRPGGKHPWCKPCRNASNTAHYSKSDKSVRREQVYSWRAANRDKVLEINRATHERNKEKRNAYCREYRAKNLETVRALSRDWSRNNPDKVKLTNAERRAAKCKAVPAWADDEFEAFAINQIYALARHRARVTGVEWHVDHAVPLRSKKVCGLHWSANLRVIPGVVNHIKGNRVWPDMP